MPVAAAEQELLKEKLQVCKRLENYRLRHCLTHKALTAKVLPLAKELNISLSYSSLFRSYQAITHPNILSSLTPLAVAKIERILGVLGA